MAKTRTAQLVLLVSLLAGQVCWAEQRLGIGLFTPDVPFADARDRYNFVQGLARHLSDALGTPVTGLAYKGARDFERDEHAKKIHFGVVSALYVATAKGSRVLAQAQLRSQSDKMWCIMGQQKADLASLAGKLLQIPTMGPLTTKFVENGLLGGNVQLTKHFKIDKSPELTSAITALRVGRADLVVAPMSTKGLTAVTGCIAIPPPAFVLLDRSLPPEMVSKAAAAVRSYGAAGASIQGWQAADAGAYAALNAASQRKALPMIMSVVTAHRLAGSTLIDTEVLQAQLPNLEDLFWVP